MFDEFAPGRVPQPHGTPVLAIEESPIKPVVFPVTRVCVGPAVEVTDGKDRLLGVSANPAVVVEYIGSAPSSVLGIAAPNPLLVQGDGTGRKEVAGLA